MTSTLDRRLENTSQTAGEIHRRLGELGRANEEILARANDLKRLEQALRPPKARGGFGELLLENLLRDRLPATAFALQHGFAGGERVDAVIKVDRLVPIDSKFPLDNFERMLGAENDIERQQFEKLFARDVKSHVDAIGGKYIRPDEGTYDFAFMYLPSEAIYYEPRLREDRCAARLRARQARPSRLSDDADRVPAGDRARAQGPPDRAARAGGHGVLLPAAERLREVQGGLRAGRDHVGRAQNKFMDAQKRLGRFESKLEQAGEAPRRAARRGARAPRRRRRLASLPDRRPAMRSRLALLSALLRAVRVA